MYQPNLPDVGAKAGGVGPGKRRVAGTGRRYRHASRWAGRYLRAELRTHTHGETRDEGVSGLGGAGRGDKAELQTRPQAFVEVEGRDTGHGLGGRCAYAGLIEECLLHARALSAEGGT